MTAILPRRLRVHPCLGRRNLLAFLCLYQRKQPPNLPVCDQSASAPMNRNTLGLIVVGSGTLFVVSQELLLSPVKICWMIGGWYVSGLSETWTVKHQNPHSYAIVTSELSGSGDSHHILAIFIYHNIHCRAPKKIATPPAQKIGLL